MSQRIVYTNQQGGISVIIPAPEWTGSMEELANKDVPAGLPYKIIEIESIPSSRNWRNAWVDGGELVTVDLEKAKEAHKQLIAIKAKERVEANAFGEQNFGQVSAEMDALDIDGVTDLQQLYNLWPESIQKRSSEREYKMHSSDN